MKKNVPEIRFKGYQGEWVVYDASSIFETYYDKNHPNLPVLSASQELGMVVRESVGFQVQHNKENEAGYKRVLPGQFVIHLRSFQGGFAHSKVEGITSPAYTVMRFRSSSEQDDIYWKYVLTSKTFIKRLETVTYGIRDGRSTSFEDFSELDFTLPSVSEQEKIGLFLTTLDKLIAKLEAKLDKLRKLKQALLNKMFINVNVGGGKVPEIRFKGYNDKWEVKELSYYFTVALERNQAGEYDKNDIYSVSREFGVINQIEYQGKSFAGASLANYGVVQSGDLVYTKSPLKFQPYGIIKTNEGLAGIVSALYGVYHPSVYVHSPFTQVYFELDSRLNDYLRPLVNKGAKNTLLISDGDFLSGKVTFPAKGEQRDIANLFKECDLCMRKADLKLTKIRSMKQGLLQKMFA